MNTIPPLLVLAAGGRVRARRERIPRPAEFSLQCLVADTLRDYALEDWRWTHFPAGEKRSVITGARLKRMGLNRGWPDFLLLAPKGRLHCLELKREGEELSSEQRQMQRWCFGNGVPYAVAASLKDALAALAGWNVLKVKV